VRPVRHRDDIWDELTTSEQNELVRLRGEGRRLEMENEILRRTGAYFAAGQLTEMMFLLVLELTAELRADPFGPTEALTLRPAYGVGGEPVGHGKREADGQQQAIAARASVGSEQDHEGWRHGDGLRTRRSSWA
jgi:hypothetical protein